MNVGDAVWQAMQQHHDTPIHDSHFHNSSFHVEWGFGEKNDYFGTDAFGSWQVSVKPKNTELGITDMRGKLPRRGAQVYPQRDLTKVDTFCVHYTGAPPERNVMGVAKYQTTTQTGDLFPEIAYHLFIEKSGEVVWCHDLNKRTWGSGQPGMNERAVHVCYSGNHSPNPEQLLGLHKARNFSQYSILQGKILEVKGHKDGYATQCPGPLWPQWKDQI